MTKRTPNQRTALYLGGVVAGMLGLSYAAVPLYDLFCRVTGYGGTTSVAEASTGEVLDRTITVRFDATISPDMPWKFRPVERTMELKIGETGLAFYEAENPTDETIAGTASFNVAPFTAGSYFAKIACFCFEMQVLEPGERIEMPVTFYIDPAIVDDIETRNVKHITLSYTMHRTDLPQDAAAVETPSRFAAATSPTQTTTAQ